MAPDTRGEGAIHQFASTYANARWFLGAGVIALTLLNYTTGSPPAFTWVLAAAGGIIIAHAFALRAWEIEDTVVALLVDVTATFIAALVLTTAEDHSAVILTMVGASVLIACSRRAGHVD